VFVTAFSRKIESFGEFHVYFNFHLCMGICQHDIQLSSMPSLYDCQSHVQSDCGLLYHCSEGFPVIDSVFLLPSMRIQSCLALTYFSCPIFFFLCISHSESRIVHPECTSLIGVITQCLNFSCVDISFAMALMNSCLSGCAIS